MKIQIAERIRPFSHLPGDSVLIPRSSIAAKIFPCLIVLYPLDRPDEKVAVKLAVTGPLKNFTIQSDLEIGEVKVWGESEGGFLRYTLSCETFKDQICLSLEKAVGDVLELSFAEKKHLLNAKARLTLFKKGEIPLKEYSKEGFERLSLGSSRLQNWPMVVSRMQIEEILPVFYRFAQWLPDAEDHSSNEGAWEPIHNCLKYTNEKKHEMIIPCLKQLFMGFFSGILVPRLVDEQYQGFGVWKGNIPDSFTSLSFIPDAIRLIRSLFVVESSETVNLLPHLPPEFHAGRFLNIKTEGGVIQLEWTKKEIRRMEYKALEDHNKILVFNQKKKCRLRVAGNAESVNFESGQKVEFKKYQQYFFDNFL